MCCLGVVSAGTGTGTKMGVINCKPQVVAKMEHAITNPVLLSKQS